jgi:hypothetical protein
LRPRRRRKPDRTTAVEPLVARLCTLDELSELRRDTLRYARSFPSGDERNLHRQLAVSLRTLFKGEMAAGSRSQRFLTGHREFVDRE